MVSALVVLLCAWINRVRGGGLGGQYLPGAGDLWAAPAMAILAVLCGVRPIWSFLDPWYLAGPIFAACYLAWSTPAWGCLYGLWFWKQDRAPSWYEALMLRAAGKNTTLAFGYRMTLFLLPMALVFGWRWLLLGPALVLAYIAGWLIGAGYIRWRKIVPADAYGIPFCEPLAGACWGIALILTA